MTGGLVLVEEGGPLGTGGGLGIGHEVGREIGVEHMRAGMGIGI